jgi:thiamine-monophosphate kinase
MIISDLTERDLIARIQRMLPPPPDWMVIGIGDDAAVVEAERNRLEVISVDALVEGVHFDRRFTPPAAIGHRALAVNLSDLAAMGAAPRLALLSLVLPPALPCDDFDGIVSGLVALAARHRLHVAGGNLARSPGPLVIDITVIGAAKRRHVLTRGGARPGDEIYVSGTIGAAAAGLRALKAGATIGTEVDDARSASVVDLCVRRFLYPEPRVRLGLLLSRNRAASACVDLSDGLADSVRQIALASGVGATIDGDALPIDPGARLAGEAASADSTVEAISAGDDYELLFTVRPQLRGRLKAASRHSDAPFTRIGVCTGSADLILHRGDSGDQPLPEGYSHFR